MKQFKGIGIFSSVLVIALVCAGCSSSAAPPVSTSPTTQPVDATIPPSQPTEATLVSTTPTPISGQSEIVTAPPDLTLFQNYLDLIRDPSRDSVDFIIEGTVISVQQTELCPYQEENCSIPPYPNDWGLVRVDAIMADPGTADKVSEGIASSSDSEEDVRTTEQNLGVDSPDEVKSALEVGQEVQAQFLLTTRPAVARWVPAIPEDNNREQAVSSEGAVAPGSEFQPIPLEDGRYVFTIGVSSSDQIEETVLPGLEAGDRFRAAVNYDGIVRIMVYEPLS
jgi:hypothetical protein